MRDGAVGKIYKLLLEHSHFSFSSFKSAMRNNKADVEFTSFATVPSMVWNPFDSKNFCLHSSPKTSVPFYGGACMLMRDRI